MITLQQIKDSSMLAAAGHDPATNTLAVMFHGGEVFHYYNTPADVYEGLLISNSKGKFFGSEIRGKYDFLKLTPEQRAQEYAL